MGLTLRRSSPERERTRAQRRAASLPTEELTMWADQALYVISQNMSAWRRDRDPVFLEEARVGADALQAVVEELHLRADRR